MHYLVSGIPANDPDNPNSIDLGTFINKENTCKASLKYRVATTPGNSLKLLETPEIRFTLGKQENKKFSWKTPGILLHL